MSTYLAMSEIYKELEPELGKNMSFPNPKLVVCFSGVSGVGKTTLAKRLEKDLNAVRLNNDDIRLIIERGRVDRDTRELIKEQFIEYFREIFFSWPNGAIVIDSGIDRRYQRLKEDFQKRGYPLLVISLFAPREVLEQRILQREGHRAEKEGSLLLLEKWIKDKENFVREYGNEIDITIDATQQLDYDALMQKIHIKMFNLTEVKMAQS